MTETTILQKLRALPPDKRQEVIDFIDFLLQRIAPPASQRTTFYGLWSDLNVDLSADDLDAARRDTWNDFPRPDLP
ncbi:DUF2281 domain-containing protein [Rhodocaloribacter litoris]|uniref:DUF2281 domain-containing protein n=1 Tax=Rhodocaloribacter litoris TaxID=2558931 RepID=UPI001E37DAC0|nr:DUF2281 domain-containing protein [Rhodocaloribacter litoris]QXD15501.1 DUF2281 domain-containing protein [Rhodocaloribacter litoris]